MGQLAKRRLAASATPWDGIPASELTPAQALVAESHRRAYSFRHGPLDGDIAFFNGYERGACAHCGHSHVVRHGLDPSGIRRWRCKGCGKTFTPTTGTIFEDRKLSLSDWSEFLARLFSYESINAMTRENKRSDTTVPYWLAKVFSILEGVQDDMVLSGIVQIDETYYPVMGRDEVSVGGVRLRGISRNKICIAVGCDSAGRSYFARAGFGKPSKKKAMDAYGSHIACGSILIHDKEKSHRKLVEELRLVDFAHDSRLISKLQGSDNPLQKVNHLCFLLKRFLRAHSGFDRDDLDGWLNLFAVMMNPPENKLEKAALVLDRAMSFPKTLRFRDFYNVRSSSGGV